MANKIKNKKKILSAVLVLAGIVTAGAVVISNWNNIADLINPSTEIKLDTPTNVQYDGHIATWDGVENADFYNLQINNGDIVKVNSNAYSFTPTSNTTTIKVQAGSQNIIDYSPSNWSNECTYTLDVNNTNDHYAILASYINKKNTTKIDSIAGFEKLSDTEYVVYANATEDNGRKVFQSTEIGFDTGIATFEDFITNLDNASTWTGVNQSAEVDAGKSFLKSNSFKGQLEEARLDGWQTSLVGSATSDYDHSRDVAQYNLVSTVKLEKGTEVKYASYNYTVVIPDASANPVNNFTGRVENPSTRSIGENNFLTLENGFDTFAEKMQEVHKAAEETLESTQEGNMGGGIENEL